MAFDVKELLSAYFDFVKRIAPKPGKGPVIGVDIGTGAVKAVLLTPSAGDTVEIGAWAVIPIVGGDIKKALSGALAKVGYTDQSVVTAVSGKGTLIRYLDMPRMPLEDLRKSLVFDLDKYFPFDPNTIYTDCSILPHSAKDKRMPVLVAAVKKELVDERLQMFKEAGAELSHITLNSIVTTNAFERLGPPVIAGGQAKAVLDIGSTVSNIIVIKDNSPYFTRDIFIGSDEMTKQIANILGVDAGMAEQLKRAPGERTQQVMDACEAAVSHLVAEIRLSLDYFMTEKNIQIDEFFLLGGGSLLKGVDAIFAKNLGLSVKTWDPLARAKLSPAAEGSGIRDHAAQLGVALGLALTNL